MIAGWAFLMTIGSSPPSRPLPTRLNRPSKRMDAAGCGSSSLAAKAASIWLSFFLAFIFAAAGIFAVVAFVVLAGCFLATDFFAEVFLAAAVLVAVVVFFVAMFVFP
ncbi:hypothetical protein [Rubripirellula obstinata]|uniref:hypothetical protein n=1 Tax=Rubripirellula obstinata TaxID=406547 RepID=UPI0012F99F0D|nr:hypothetical protein [Rubripirellula obstinata]